MKKAIKQAALFLFALCFSFMMVLTVATPHAAAAANASRKSQVFSYLTESLGFNAAAACGIMSNIEHESDFNPSLVIIDCNGRPSGGLCQWNGGRYRNLINFCSNNGYNHLSIQGQLEYLKHELKNSYSGIYNYMKRVPDTVNGAYDAAYYWCYHFEVPTNRARKAAGRGSSAARNYWPLYCVNNISAVTPSSKADDQTLDLADSVTVTWKKATGNFTGYIASVAEKKGDGFDWDNAKTFTFGKDVCSLKQKLSDLGVGRYAVRVCALNDLNGYQGACENTVKFNVKCLSHQMQLTKRVEPTFASTGKKIRTCEKCGLKETTALKKLSKSAFESGVIRDFDVVSRTANEITLSWKYLTGAQGFCLYQLIDGEWVRLQRMTTDHLSFTVQNLKPGTRYSFKVAAYAKNGNKNVFCKGDTLSVYTRPANVKITDIKAQQGTVWLQWSASKHADGYSVMAAADDGKGFVEVASTSADTTQAIVKKLKTGAHYSFYVRAYILSDKGNKIFSDPSAFAEIDT